MATATRPHDIARRMLEGGTFLLVRTGKRVEPRDVAAEIHVHLSTLCPSACWLHELHDLRRVFRFAVDHPELPMVVTTSTSDWTPLDHDRSWKDRDGSITFVMPSPMQPSPPAQVATLFVAPILVRRNPFFDGDERLRDLSRRVEAQLTRLVDDVARLQHLADHAGIDLTRIDPSGGAELVAHRILRESLRCDRLDAITHCLVDRYDQEVTRALHAEVRSFYRHFEE